VRYFELEEYAIIGQENFCIATIFETSLWLEGLYKIICCFNDEDCRTASEYKTILMF
jgi:hypothetical protein